MALRDLNNLCTPAQLYLFITLFSLVIMIYQNAGTYENVICVGNYECHNAPNKGLLALIKLFYIGFWTFVLQMICKGGYKNVSWFLVLLPVILFMLFLIFGMGPWNYTGSVIIEGMTNLSDVKTAKDGANYVAEQVNSKSTRLINLSDNRKKKGDMTFESHKSILKAVITSLNNTARASANKIK